MKRQALLMNMGIGVLVVCALVVTGLVVRRELFQVPPGGGQPPNSRSISDWASYASGHRLGRTDARVTITQFSDFQCPYCRMLAERLDVIRNEYGAEVAVVYRHFPLRGHPYAAAAARASECAAAQGRFWAFHDVLFANQDSIGTLEWMRFASDAKVSDLETFANCIANSDVEPAIARDMLAGRGLGVRGTPTFLVNDRLIRGAVSLEDLRELVEAALGR